VTVTAGPLQEVILALGVAGMGSYFAVWIFTSGFAGSGIPDRRVWGARQKSKYDT
jgi:hypothetical protein